MDYAHAAGHRSQSFKEFMSEWIVGQFERTLIDLGLDLPWYWNQMIDEFDYQHHAYQMGIWFWRPTLWWNPAAGVTPDAATGWRRSTRLERHLRQVLGRDHRQPGGRPAELTAPETLPIVCNMSQIPICASRATAGTSRTTRSTTRAAPTTSTRRSTAGSSSRIPALPRPPDAGRPLPGREDPADGPDGALQVHEPRPGEIGDDAHQYAWPSRQERPRAASPRKQAWAANTDEETPWPCSR